MTIKKRTEWGTVVIRTDIVRRECDHDLLDNVSFPTSGDMHLTLGSPGSEDASHERTRQTVWRELPVDRIVVRLDGAEPIIAAATITAGRFWFGDFCIVANTAFVRGRNVFHASHPNDGFIEFLVIDSRMTIRQRLTALRRVAHGTHVPHPFVSGTRGKHKLIRFARPKQIRVDGQRVGRCSELEVEVVPDAGTVYIPTTETIEGN